MARIIVSVMLAAAVSAAPSKTTQHSATNSASVSAKHGKMGSSSRRSRRARKPAAPSYQLHPDPERYTQIQQALIDRGYFKGQANGQWGDDSVDALKRFQADQKLDTPDGKINAHSLTALGLGPKHDGTSAATVPLSAASDPAPAPSEAAPAASPFSTEPDASSPQSDPGTPQ